MRSLSSYFTHMAPRLFSSILNIVEKEECHMRKPHSNCVTWASSVMSLPLSVKIKAVMECTSLLRFGDIMSGKHQQPSIAPDTLQVSPSFLPLPKEGTGSYSHWLLFF